MIERAPQGSHRDQRSSDCPAENVFNILKIPLRFDPSRDCEDPFRERLGWIAARAAPSACVVEVATAAILA